MTIGEAEERLGFRIDELKAVPVDTMLAGSHSTSKAVKKRVYRRIVECIEIEGYPTEASSGFKEPKVSDLVYSIISPILVDFRRTTGRNLRLEREKEIISMDGETGGAEEFVVMDRISVTKEKFVLIIEGKRGSVGEAMKQCLLSLKDAGDIDNGSKVYGFVTTGEGWRMLCYDGTSFQMTNKFHATFDTMGDEKDKWMQDYSRVVDCIHFALSNGGL